MPFWIVYGYPIGVLAFAIVGAAIFYGRARMLDRGEKSQLE